jgi:RNA polymerase sigma-70 factor (ECF subfamily)
VHVIRHTSQVRSIAIAPQDAEDLAAEVFAAILADDYGVLRRFRGQSSLATYLTVVARRVVVRELLKRRIVPNLSDTTDMHDLPDGEMSVEERVSNREQVERMLDELQGEEAEIVRLYHLDGKSYTEISHATGVPENTIGPTLSRARAKMRRSSDSATATS